MVKGNANSKGTPVPPHKSTVRKVTRDPHSSAKNEKCKELTRSSFRDGEVSTPYVNVWIHGFENLQFIQATVLVTSDDEEHKQEFTNVWWAFTAGGVVEGTCAGRLPSIHRDLRSAYSVPKHHDDGFLSWVQRAQTQT